MSTFTQFNRFNSVGNARNIKPLERDSIARIAPAVFADTAAKTVSQRYEFISTHRIFDILDEHGYLPVKAQQSQGGLHAKHMVAFQHRNTLEGQNVVGGVLERINLYNSHNAKSAYILQAGMFRLTCLNGATVSIGQNGKVSIRHSGRDVIDNVANGLAEECWLQME